MIVKDQTSTRKTNTSIVYYDNLRVYKSNASASMPINDGKLLSAIRVAETEYAAMTDETLKTKYATAIETAKTAFESADRTEASLESAYEALVTCFESVDLHKKYNFLTYLVKEIEVGGSGNDFDIADKITASNFEQKKTGEKTAQIESKPEVELPKPNEVFFDEQVKKKLSEIIEEINASCNKNFDVDVKLIKIL